jgi:3alpha(or 20beta)-hydroxysteroid dehydrogenase
MPAPTPATTLQDLLDRAAISDTKLNYATGIDRRDWALYRSIFADTVEIDFSTWSGLKTSMTADDWVASVRDTLACFDATQHTMINHVISLDGDTAQLVTQMSAAHYFEGELQILAGFYTNRLRRSGQCWKITACNLVITMEHGDRGLFARAHARGPMLATPNACGPHACGPGATDRYWNGGNVSMDRIKDKVALVTGGASGLGEAIVRRFVAEGAHVIAADIDAPRLAALTGALGGRATALQLDVTQEADWLSTFAEVDRLHGRCDVLVNNAGITTVGSVESLSLADFRTMLDIDLVGVFLGCKHVVPLMKRSGGAVINMSSMSGLRAEGYLAGYNAAKAGVTLLTKSAALHYAREGYGIRCNSVHPGAIHTPILEKVMSQVDDPDALYATWVGGHPIGRLGRPEEVAALVLYLASDESAFATGAEFKLDGGSSL